ncbi:MAG: 30S ribosomal protein S8 [Deltaproteobacteria bacterium]|nr:30S ribosomal protein S8 [Deltaproteobacteria bacterium]
MVDPISDLLNRIRNAAMAQHASTRVPLSKVKVKILEILKNEGYIDDFSVDEKDGIRGEIVIYLKYLDSAETAVRRMRRVSTPGRRLYCGAKNIARVKNGLGVSIVSTSKGIMTDRDARRLNVGGEVLCEIW